MRDWHRWLPAGILGCGCLLLVSVQRQQAMPLRGSLESLPRHLGVYTGYDQKISADEQAVAGMSDYLLRIFATPDTVSAFSVYVGYYEQQTQGRTIHSPKNCLPGAGWEPISSSRQPLAVGSDTVMVNRYELVNKNARALVYYWYEGRGRVEPSEYRVKWELLRDAALTGRSEEALVRIVVPITEQMTNPDSVATSVGQMLVPAVRELLPEPA
ncbi:MAG TPA: EpsI family protein [Gemmatimonadales bacterium]|jgi:EpsI family protein|nr:EpsI family protein [Gemmatimonadales bacterium]